MAREIHAGVRIRVGPGEVDIDGEHRGATFHYDTEENKVVVSYGSGGQT